MTHTSTLRKKVKKKGKEKGLSYTSLIEKLYRLGAERQFFYAH